MLENPKQKFVVRHYSENDFKGGGLRGEAEYRDLGVADVPLVGGNTQGSCIIIIRVHVPRCRFQEPHAKD